MKSSKCLACGFVGFSDANRCKSCGASLGPMSSQYSHEYSNWGDTQLLNKSLANVALVLGLLSLFTFGLFVAGAIAGVIVAILAVKKAEREPMKYGGRRTAMTGLVLSLVSLMVVIPVSTYAIQNLYAAGKAGFKEARFQALEGSAINTIRQISYAEVTYYRTHRRYGTMAELANDGLVEPALVSGKKNEYAFSISFAPGPNLFSEDPQKGFSCIGQPIVYRPRPRSFLVDQTLVVRSVPWNGLISPKDAAGDEAP